MRRQDIADLGIDLTLQAADGMKDTRKPLTAFLTGAPKPFYGTKLIDNARRLPLGPFKDLFQAPLRGLARIVMTMELRPSLGRLPDFGSGSIGRIAVFGIAPRAFDDVSAGIGIVELGIMPQAGQQRDQ